MTQLTNEERARIFGMYINQSCYHDDKIFDIYAVHSDGLISLKYNESLELGLHILNTRHPKLILMPLSKITDEDAIEVAKIHGLSPLYQTTKEGYSIASQIRRLSYHPRYAESSYLIQKGYAIPLFIGIGHPYNDKTAFELGIAIDRTLLKK